jgi:hypothetical protein
MYRADGKRIMTMEEYGELRFRWVSGQDLKGPLAQGLRAPFEEETARAWLCRQGGNVACLLLKLFKGDCDPTSVSKGNRPLSMPQSCRRRPGRSSIDGVNRRVTFTNCCIRSMIAKHAVSFWLTMTTDAGA